MRSRTSFFNRAVFFSDLRRWWPLTALYALAWFMSLPLTRLTELNHDRGLSVWNMRSDALDIAANAGYWAAFFAGILFAMAAFSYLTNPRATNGLHALPARRETLYVTHWLAGLVSQLAPQLLAVLLTEAVLASHGALDARTPWLMLLALALPTLFFYSFGVFCVMFTGQILAAPVFYGVLNFLVVGVELLLRGFAGNFLYGWAGSGTPCLTAFSPLIEMVERGIRAWSDAGEGAMDGDSALYHLETGNKLLLQGLDTLLIYAAVGIVFAALGLLVYRKRHSEATGSTVAIGWARPIFKYGVTFCTALALGQLFYYLFFGQYRTNGNFSLPGALACMAAAALIGYFTAEMLLKKSFRVWKGGWKGAAAVTLALAALGVAMSFDLFGFESRVPDEAKVEWATVSWYGGNGDHFSVQIRDGETLRLAAGVHRAFAADKQRQLSIDRGDLSVTDSDARLSSGSLYLAYCLKDGRMVNRSYDSFLIWADELGDAASPAAALTALYNAPVVKLQRTLSIVGMDYGPDCDPARLPDLRFTGGYCRRTKHSETGGYLGEEERELTAAEAREIFDAIVRDAESGRVRDSLFGYEPELWGALDLYATYLDTSVDASTLPVNPNCPETRRRSRDFAPRVTKQMTDTIAVLREIGIDVSFD
ncbi:MAG: hypothetical protein IJU66_02660 [Oscillospiraceae bacterium]|nr:hypothetical protein [Oscillospiraceae bacterium]